MDTNRQHLIKLALESYRRLKNTREYALNREEQNVLAILAAAVLQRRAAESRSDSESPSVRDEIAQLFQKLSDAGVNLLQRRPNDPPPTPQPWKDPVTGEALPNPWKTKDLKGQTLLMQRDPCLAEHYKKIADDPYGALAALQDEEVQRRTFAEIPYDGEHHKFNPFLSDNKTIQGDFVKRDPVLAEFYREEAKPVELKLFGANKNMTVEGRLLKNPEAATTYKIAQQIHKNWLQEDRAAAEEQRAAADATLKRLNQQIV